MTMILEGDASHFDALIYSKPHPGTVNFLQQQMETASHNLTQAGAAFMQSVNAAYDWVNFSAAANLARAVGRKVRGIWQNDEIRALVEIAQLQHAPLKMQRWIMAEPTIRTLYHKQQCDGYSDTYVDREPGLIGDQHYDYRRVMDGMIVDSSDGDWQATTYMEDLLPDDMDLQLDEQNDILTTWEFIRDAARRKKEDPTSKYNSNL